MRSMVEGALNERRAWWRAPSTTAFGGGPPPRSGEELRLAPHCFSSSRAVIIRITSLVPSRMRWTRRSRQKRSTG